jgi:hypothetical protein
LNNILFIFLILIFKPTALLICTENTFWDISSLNYGDFVESFKKSFTLYVESRMMEKVETDIDMLRNEQGEFLVTEDFEAKFHKFIVDHHLSKFHCSNLDSPYLIILFVLQPPLENHEPVPVPVPVPVENQGMENLGLARNASVDPMPVPVGVKLRVLSWNNGRKRGLLGCGT